MKKIYCFFIMSITFMCILFNGTKAWAGITFDASADGGGYINSTTCTYSLTVGSGSNRLLVVHAWCTQTSPGGVTNVTYNGVGLTKIAEQFESGQGTYVSMWYLLNPASGPHNIVVSSNQNGIISTAASYAGVRQSAQPDNYVTGENYYNLTLSLIPVADACWTVLVERNLSSPPSAGTGSTQRQGTPAGGGIFDSNGPEAASVSTSMEITGSDNIAGIMASFAPAPTVSAISPNNAFNNAFVNITSVTGNSFILGATVKLSKAAQSDINCTGFTFTNSTTLSNGSCPVTGAATGTWDVVVTNPDTGADTLANGFTVNSPPVSATVDWNNSNVQEIVLSDNRAFTFNNGNNGAVYTLVLKQDGTGGRVVVWPSNVKWIGGIAPVLTSNANAVDLVKFVYDGTNYLAYTTALDMK